MNTVGIFENFCSTLGKWTENAIPQNELGTLSEDTVCFFLAASFLQAGVEIHAIEMEVPHPALKARSGAQKDVDIRVLCQDETQWVEVKLDKKIPSGKTLNKTNRFGKLVNDMLRAGLLQGGKSFVVYVTDEVMAEYVAKNFPSFLEGSVLFLEQGFLTRLPPSAAKEIDPKVTDKMPHGGLSVRVLCTRKISPWTCLLYEISPRV